MRKPLRTGYTTGACAAAAAKGAALMLARQEPVNEVTILLPADVSATFALHGQAFAPDAAACYVIKDAGDDPDVTNGAEVHARVTVAPPPLMGGGRGEGEAARGNSDGDSSAPPTPALPHEGGGRIFISGGTGIGKATKPGLAVAPGEWAINPVPRRMIEQAVRAVFPKGTLGVEISIPDGEQRAQRTLNARLGIVGGLSILGTSGIVRPISAKAWTDTIDAALDVARACGCPTVVLSTGRTSEMAAQRHLEYPPPLMGGGEGEGDGKIPPTPALPHQGGGKIHLPEEAFIMMGDHVAHALRACAERGFPRPVIACQFAKLLKIACGYENTHAAASELDLDRLRSWAEAARLSTPLRALIDGSHTAREIALESGFDRALLEMVCDRARAAARTHAPDIQAVFQVADYSGNIVYYSN